MVEGVPQPGVGSETGVDRLPGPTLMQPDITAGMMFRLAGFQHRLLEHHPPLRRRQRTPEVSLSGVDERRSVLVGATFTGVDVAEFVHAATIAVVGEVPLERLWHAVPSFPTRSEVWLRLLEAYGL